MWATVGGGSPASCSRSQPNVAEVFEWLSTAEAAEMLEVTVQRIYELIDQGHLAGYRFGRVIRLRREDVDRYRGDDGNLWNPTRGWV